MKSENVRQPLLPSSTNRQPAPFSVQAVDQDVQQLPQQQQPPPTSKDGLKTEGRHRHVLAVTNAKVWSLSLLNIVCFLGVRVALPIYSENTGKAGGDVFTLLLYISLWFPVVLGAVAILYKALWDRSVTLLPVAVRWRVLWAMGALTLANGFCATFASPPSRTAPYLQGLLITMRIPFTVLMRLAILRKGISLRRAGCTVAVVIGVFITVEPQIWSLPGSGGNGSRATGGSSGAAARVIWPMIFALGCLPAAANAVLCERELKRRQAQSLSVITWSLFLELLIVLPLFWVDFIPFFGMAKSFEEFAERMRRGFACNLSLSEACHGLALKGWVFILAFCFGNLFQFLLIQRAEGAVFAVVVQSVVTPLATLFWTFFRVDGVTGALRWQPAFTETTGFTIGGLLIIVPAAVWYNVFSRWDAAAEKEKKKKEKEEEE
ncbi:uncharacterized protein LOC143300613 [Babylonia areolata]|uniref:uncharacterized protein LOC143300613 n=1 Tax=Babylonia areolata TaxID=304850 RepID=UPI003FD05618